MRELAIEELLKENNLLKVKAHGLPDVGGRRNGKEW